MFGRNKKDSSRNANELAEETEPNVLSGSESEIADADPLADPKTLYGPNGEAVAGLLEALDEIDLDQVGAVAASWASVKPADRQIAQMMARRLRNDRRLDAPLRAAETRVQAWLQGRETTDDRGTSLNEEAAGAARDAVAALILDTELNDADFATLYGPWSDVMDDDVEADEAEQHGAPLAEEAADAAEQTDAERDFGPNGDLIAELLARLEDLSPDQARSLATAVGSADPDALAQAHAAVEGALEADPDSRDELKRAQERVAEWAAGGDVRLRGDAAPAVVDAVTALAMVDAVSEADAATLYAPWAVAVGAPELPALEDEGPS